MSQPSASSAAPGWKFQRRHPVCSACERPFEDGEVHFSVLSIRAGELIREDPCFRCWTARPAGSDSPAGQTDGAPEATETEAAEPESAEVQAAETAAPEIEAAETANEAQPTEGESTAAPLEGAEAETAGEAAQPEEVFWWRTRHQDQKKKGLALNLPALEALFVSLEGRRERAVRELRYLVCLILMRKRRVKLVRIKREKSGEAFEVRRPRRQESLRVWVFDFSPERIDELRTELVALFDAHEGSEEDEAGPQPESGADEGSEGEADGQDAEAGAEEALAALDPEGATDPGADPESAEKPA